jgi:signal transduction histidine kinase/ActR/RegA family two-component response regulator
MTPPTTSLQPDAGSADAQLAELRRDLRASEARFHAIVDRSTDGMIVLRTDGIICFANPAAERMLGRGAEELLGEMFGVPFVPGKVTEVNVLQPGGGNRIAEMQVVTTQWQDRPSYLATLHDITDRKRAEEEAREGVRRRDEFLAILSHELRNPLAAIVNAAQVMHQRSFDDQMLSRARQIIERQGQQMTRLLDDLLDVSRVSRGKIQLRKEPLDLVQSAHEAMQVVHPFVQSRHLALHVDFHDQPLIVEADSARMLQVLINLLTNAAKYTPAEGEIHVTARREGGQAVFEVRDTGIGIAPEMLRSIFDPFVQETVNLARSEAGLGIGLSLVRSLAELHGGSVTAASPGVNQGSTFTVHWPLAIRPMPKPRSSKAGPQPAEQRIVIVEDNPDVREMLQTLMELEGHEVAAADDAPEALELIEFQRPDIALVDIGLPTFDGYEVARRIRANPATRETFLVALTGYGLPEDQRLAAEAGFDAHLVKPIDLEKLSSLLADRQRLRSQRQTVLEQRRA